MPNHNDNDKATTPDPLDALLTEGLLEVPAQFTQQVMARVWAAPLSPMRSPPRPQWQARLKQMALLGGMLGGALWGAAQLAGFIFGVWAAMSAA